MAGNLPDYVASAKPVPWGNRAHVVQEHRPDVRRRHVVVRVLAGIGDRWKHAGGTLAAGLGTALLGILVAGSDLPLPVLPRARSAGYEDRPAVVCGGYIHLRSGGRSDPSRFCDGHIAVRLDRRECLWRGHFAVQVLRHPRWRKGPGVSDHRSRSCRHGGCVRLRGGVHGPQGNPVRGTRGHVLSASSRSRFC